MKKITNKESGKMLQNNTTWHFQQKTRSNRRCSSHGIFSSYWTIINWAFWRRLSWSAWYFFPFGFLPVLRRRSTTMRRNISVGWELRKKLNLHLLLCIFFSNIFYRVRFVKQKVEGKEKEEGCSCVGKKLNRKKPQKRKTHKISQKKWLWWTLFVKFHEFIKKNQLKEFISILNEWG